MPNNMKYCVIYNRKRDNETVRTRLSSLKRAKIRLQSLANFGIEGKLTPKNDITLQSRRSDKTVLASNVVNHWRFVPTYDKHLNHIRTDCIKNGQYVQMQRCMH